MAINASNNPFPCTPVVLTRFVGEFATLLALQTAYPTASAGSYAIVNESGEDLVYYFSVADQEWFTNTDGDSGTTPNLSQVLNIGGREVQKLDTGGDVTLDITAKKKYIVNTYFSNDVKIQAGTFAIGDSLVVKNGLGVGLFALPDGDVPGIIVNGISINESSGLSLYNNATAVLTKISEVADVSENWTLSFLWDFIPIPNLQEVTDVAPASTTNDVKYQLSENTYIIIKSTTQEVEFYENVSGSPVLRSKMDKGSFNVYRNGGGVATMDGNSVFIEDATTENSIALNLDPSTGITALAFVSPDGDTGYFIDKIRKDSIEYALPTGTTSPLATLYDLESAIEGIKTKELVRVATTANITLSGTQTIDGISLSVDDRVLVKDQTTQSDNGIYLVKSSSWTRTNDANSSTELNNALVSIAEGTANANATFRQTTANPTIGSSNIVWSSFGTSVPDATPSTKGKMKLFADLLNSFTDGSVTQAAIVEALSLKADKSITHKLTTDYTLTNTTVLQKMFNFNGGTGAIDVVSGKHYAFRICANFTGLQAVGKTIGFGILGTATLSNLDYKVVAGLGNLTAASTAQITSGVDAASQTVTGSNTSAEGKMIIEGTFTATSDGSFIPSFSTSSSNASMVSKAGNIFFYEEINLE